MIPDTPLAYAKKLVTYISAPSTVRVRVLEWFGRAPSIERIAQLRKEYEETVNRQYPQDYSDWDGDDGVPRLRNGARPDAYHVSERDVEFIAEMAEYFGLSYDDIIGDSRKRFIQEARSIINAILIESGCSCLRAAILMGRNESSTARRSYKKLKETRDINPLASKAYFHFRDRLGIKKPPAITSTHA